MDETVEQKPKPSWLRTLGALYLDVQWISMFAATLAVFLQNQAWTLPLLGIGLLLLYGFGHWGCRPTPGEWLSGITRRKLSSSEHVQQGQKVRYVELRIPQQLPRLVYAIGLLQIRATMGNLSFSILSPVDYFLGVQIEGLWKFCVDFFRIALQLGYTMCLLRMKTHALPLTIVLLGLGGLDSALNHPYWQQIAELWNRYYTLTRGRTPPLTSEQTYTLLLLSSACAGISLLSVIWHRNKFVR